MIKSYKFIFSELGAGKTVTVCCMNGESEEKCLADLRYHYPKKTIEIFTETQTLNEREKGEMQ